MRGLRLPLTSARSPDDYEAVLSPLYAWIHALAQIEGRPARAESDASTRVWHCARTRWQRADRRRPERYAAARSRSASTCSWRPINRSGIGPSAGGRSACGARRAGLRAMGEAVSALRDRTAARGLRPHAPRRAAARRRPPSESRSAAAPASQHRLLDCTNRQFLGDRPSVSPTARASASSSTTRARRVCSTFWTTRQPGGETDRQAVDPRLDPPDRAHPVYCTGGRSARRHRGDQFV